MSDRIDLVYDRPVTNVKRKAGAKYERLAAIAFRILTERTTVQHDLRLRGKIATSPERIGSVGGSVGRRAK